MQHEGNYMERIEELKRRGEQIRREIAEVINSLADNPRAKKLGKRAFFVRSKEVFSADNWTPEFHDFKAQHEAILQHIKSMRLESVPDFLSAAANNGLFRRHRNANEVVRLHPDVIRQIKEIIER